MNSRAQKFIEKISVVFKNLSDKSVKGGGSILLRIPILARSLQRLVLRLEPWGILIALIAFILEYSDRIEERTFRAWQLVTTEAPGNSGKIDALEYLNRRDGICFGDSCLIVLKDRTPLEGIDLSPPIENSDNNKDQFGGAEFGAFLVGVKLNDANLSGANLRYARLTQANLTNANLQNADMRRAELGADQTPIDLALSRSVESPFLHVTGANLRRANLTNADLRGANLVDVDLRSTKLGSADMRQANLRSANLSQSDLSGWQILQGSFSEPESSAANLSGANLTGSRLVNTNLDSVNLTNANLSNANLAGALVRGADLRHANFEGSELTGTRFDGAKLRGAQNLTQQQLEKACGNYKTTLPEGLEIPSCLPGRFESSKTSP